MHCIYVVVECSKYEKVLLRVRQRNIYSTPNPLELCADFPQLAVSACTQIKMIGVRKPEVHWWAASRALYLRHSEQLWLVRLGF